eukprot:1962802-Amphidinium_carterae.1
MPPPEWAQEVFQVAVEQEAEESTAEARLLRMLEGKTIQLVATRTNVGPGSHRTMCLGGYTQRGVGITMKSWEFQREIQIIVEDLRSKHAEVEFTSISLAMYEAGQSLPIHKDDDHGVSWIRAWGQFTGGRLWVASASGSVPPPPECGPVPEGCPPLGEFRSMADWMCLDAHEYHCVESVREGRRYSTSCFCCRHWQKLSKKDWKGLVKLHFPVQ